MRKEERIKFSMELKQLQYFVVSVDAGSLSKAAEILYTTQPHVSKTIQKLEASLGISLLKRGKKGVVLTPEGEKVYLHARKMLSCMQAIAEIPHNEEGEKLSLTSMPSRCLAGIFSSFYAKEDHVPLRFLEGSLDKVLHQLAHNQADVGFVFVPRYQMKAFEGNIARKKLEFVLIEETPLMLYVGPENPYYHRTSVTRTELQKIQYLQNGEDDIPLFHYPGHLRDEGLETVHCRMTAEVDNDHVMMELLLKTQLGYISCMLNEPDEDNSRIHAIALEGNRTKINFGYVKKKDRELNSCCRRFLDYVEERLRKSGSV